MFSIEPPPSKLDWVQWPKCVCVCECACVLWVCVCLCLCLHVFYECVCVFVFACLRVSYKWTPWLDDQNPISFGHSERACKSEFLPLPGFCQSCQHWEMKQCSAVHHKHQQLYEKVEHLFCFFNWVGFMSKALFHFASQFILI